MRVDLPQPEGADITMKSGFVFMANIIPKSPQGGVGGGWGESERDQRGVGQERARKKVESGWPGSSVGLTRCARSARRWRLLLMKKTIPMLAIRGLGLRMRVRGKIGLRMRVRGKGLD